MQFYFPDTPDLPLPPRHRFPSGKYRMLRELAMRESLLGDAALLPSPAATRDELIRAHDADFVDTALLGNLSEAQQRRIGVPWSETLVTRARAVVGGSLAAGRAALASALSGQLAGGTHHAHRAFGSGFCVFNDLAVASLTLLDEGAVGRIAIVDLDVHQGDGTAAILGNDGRVFTLSIHGANNFPFEKPASTLDVGLPDGTDDDGYMAALLEALPAVEAFRPDLVFYLSGADLLREDRLGRLDLTHGGLMLRDRVVLSLCQRRGWPVAIVIGGGYAEPIEASITAYANTFRVAREVYGF